MSFAKSVVISCAGIGSRLGLATTKALIDLGGKTLIARQLELLKDVEDIKIVVGYQAADLIQEVRKYREDVVFCYNHEYFTTKTARSYYLGARYGNPYAVELDGDLLVHPDDLKMLLKMEGEWIGYSDISSDDAVFLTVDENDMVVSFSRKEGNYEWTGPACIRKDRLNGNVEHVYHQIEPLLPIRGVKIRAYDIDTYEDYNRVRDIVERW